MTQGTGVVLDRYAWLLGDHEGARQRIGSSELEAVCQFGVAVWQVLPSFLHRILCAVPTPQEVGDPLQRLSAIATATATLSSVQVELSRRLTGELERRSVPYSLLKGAAARLALYPDPRSRGGLDIDIAVPSAYLDEAVDACTTVGFLAAALDTERRHFVQAHPTEVAAVRENHYELATLARKQVIHGLPDETVRRIKQAADVVLAWHMTDDGEPACYVAVDIHHGLGLGMPVDELVETARTAKTGHHSAAVPSPAWMLFHLIYKIYWEGTHTYRRGAYQYADLIRVLPRLDAEGIDYVRALLDRYRLEAAAYYVLRRVAPAFDFVLPAGLHRLIDDASVAPHDVHPEDVNDAGDMWPKIWGRR